MAPYFVVLASLNFRFLLTELVNRGGRTMKMVCELEKWMELALDRVRLSAIRAIAL